jgi:hypothetical protein
VVEVAVVKEMEPPPVFETETGRLRAVAPCTNGKVREPGVTLRLGCPAAVIVSETGMRTIDGLAFDAVIVTVSE